MTKRVEMQKKLEDVYQYIASYVVENGYPPSIREICDQFGFRSTGSASYYLRRLEERNLIRLISNTSRGMEVLGPRPLKDKLMVPELGKITAGTPVLAFEDYGEIYELPNNLFPNANEDTFILNVEGNSMINIGIREGDKLLVRRQDHAANGQVVAALIDNETATVKRYYLEDGKVRLHPENIGMFDLFPNDCKILGVVIGLIRTNIQ